MITENLSLLAIPLAALYLAALACVYRILLTYRTPIRSTAPDYSTTNRW